MQESGRLGIIALKVKDKNNKEVVAKAPCDQKFVKDQEYDFYVWNTRYIKCPKCVKKIDKKCKLCDGTGDVLSFSYVIKKSGEDPGKPWEDNSQEEMQKIYQDKKNEKNNNKSK